MTRFADIDTMYEWLHEHDFEELIVRDDAGSWNEAASVRAICRRAADVYHVELDAAEVASWVGYVIERCDEEEVDNE